MTAVAEAATEQIVEATEQVTRAFTRNDIRYAGAAGIILGAAGGFFAAKKRYQKYYDERAEREIEAVRDMYARKYKEGVYSTPESAAAELSIDARDSEFVSAPVEAKVDYDKVVRDLDYSAGGPVRNDIVVETETEKVTVKVEPLEERIESVDARDDTKPYVISNEMFYDGEVGHEEQVTITWYVADDTLADENDQIMQDIEGTIGFDALGRFGDRSEDENIVYVRNERLGMDFEVVREPGSYKKIVTGLDEPETFERIKRTSPRRSDDG